MTDDWKAPLLDKFAKASIVMHIRGKADEWPINPPDWIYTFTHSISPNCTFDSAGEMIIYDAWLHLYGALKALNLPPRELVQTYDELKGAVIEIYRPKMAAIIEEMKAHEQLVNEWQEITWRPSMTYSRGWDDSPKK